MTAKLETFKVVDLPAMKVIGKELRVLMNDPEGNKIPPFWGECFGDGTIERLDKHPDRLYPKVHVGWMGRFSAQDQRFSYIVGVLARPDVKQGLEGLDVVDLPAAHFAVGTIAGTEPDIYHQAHDLLDKEVKDRKLVYDDGLACAIEWYDDRFEDDSAGVCRIDYLEPVKAPVAAHA
jgi:predicted transcriptional regulator YdeE